MNYFVTGEKIVMLTFFINQLSNEEYKNNVYDLTFKIFVRLVVSTSRQIEIEIENVLSVETNFFKLSRFSRPSRSTFFFLGRDF